MKGSFWRQSVQRKNMTPGVWFHLWKQRSMRERWRPLYESYVEQSRVSNAWSVKIKDTSVIRLWLELRKICVKKHKWRYECMKYNQKHIFFATIVTTGSRAGVKPTIWSDKQNFPYSSITKILFLLNSAIFLTYRHCKGLYNSTSYKCLH